MADEPFKPAPADDAPPEPPPGASDEFREARGLSDLVRRAVSAGFEAASRSKEEVVRVATGEVRNWLDRLDLDNEIVKALSKMVVEVKAEIRFRQTDDGRLTPDAVSSETRVKQTK